MVSAMRVKFPRALCSDSGGIHNQFVGRVLWSEMFTTLARHKTRAQPERCEIVWYLHRLLHSSFLILPFLMQWIDNTREKVGNASHLECFKRRLIE